MIIIRFRKAFPVFIKESTWCLSLKMHEVLFISITWELAQQNRFVEKYPIKTEAIEALINTDTGWKRSATSFYYQLYFYQKSYLPDSCY